LRHAYCILNLFALGPLSSPQRYGPHRDLLSFPTRRSSDLLLLLLGEVEERLTHGFEGTTELTRPAVLLDRRDRLLRVGPQGHDRPVLAICRRLALQLLVGATEQGVGLESHVERGAGVDESLRA